MNVIMKSNDILLLQDNDEILLEIISIDKNRLK
jgi:hypothetical protein